MYSYYKFLQGMVVSEKSSFGVPLRRGNGLTLKHGGLKLDYGGTSMKLAWISFLVLAGGWSGASVLSQSMRRLKISLVYIANQVHYNPERAEGCKLSCASKEHKLKET